MDMSVDYLRSIVISACDRKSQEKTMRDPISDNKAGGGYKTATIRNTGWPRQRAFHIVKFSWNIGTIVVSDLKEFSLVGSLKNRQLPPTRILGTKNNDNKNADWRCQS